MSRLSDRKIVIVRRATRLDELIRRHNTVGQARFFVQSRGECFDDYAAEHRQIREALTEISSIAQQLGRVQHLERSLLPGFLFGPDDIVVVAGPDGLVANTLKYLSGQPLVAVNPAPSIFDGPLLRFGLSELRETLIAVVHGDFATTAVTMARASLNDGQDLLAVNDLYIGPREPVSIRYELEWNGRTELQSSSGVIVSTGLGSSGWLLSIVAGAASVQRGGKPPDWYDNGLAWESRALVFSVREPFPSRTTGTALAFGRIDSGDKLGIASRTAEGAIVFSDGMVRDALDFNAGTVVEIGLAGHAGALVRG